jgi:hypothetical protein
VRFVISFAFGLVAEILTGLLIGAGMLARGGGGMPSNPANVPAWVPYVAMVGGAAFTFLFARWRAARDPEHAMVHALLVAAAAIGLHLATSIGAGQPFTLMHAIADACKLIAGVVAGRLGRPQASAVTPV